MRNFYLSAGFVFLARSIRINWARAHGNATLELWEPIKKKKRRWQCMIPAFRLIYRKIPCAANGFEYHARHFPMPVDMLNSFRPVFFLSLCLPFVGLRSFLCARIETEKYWNRRGEKNVIRKRKKTLHVWKLRKLIIRSYQFIVCCWQNNHLKFYFIRIMHIYMYVILIAFLQARRALNCNILEKAKTQKAKIRCVQQQCVLRFCIIHFPTRRYLQLVSIFHFSRFWFLFAPFASCIQR